jgi:hypothetical protein
MRNSFHVVLMSDANEIIREMNSLVSSYIECWEKGENRLISPTQPTGIDSLNILLADNLTLVDARKPMSFRDGRNCTMLKYIEEINQYSVSNTPSRPRN